MSATASPGFDLRDPAFLADPYPAFDRLREAAPVWKAPFGRWLLTRYVDCSLLLRDRRFGKDYSDPEALTRRFGPTALEEPAVVELSHMLLMRDPPDHTRLRGLVSKAFTARRIEALRQRVREMAERLIDAVKPAGRMDVIADLAFPLPVMVICELLGVPDEDRERFMKGSVSGGRLLDPAPPARAELDAANLSIQASGAYFEALFEKRRREPADDLITQLVQAEEAGERLTTPELRANVNMLFAAGHETTVNLIGNGLLALLRRPDQWRILRDDPSLIPNGIEEILRFESPVQAVSRVLAEAVDIGGVTLGRKEMVVAALGAGNRDPAVFENAHRLDVTRKDPNPLSFGGGIHFCLGAQLARIEAAEVFGAVLSRLPDLRLAEPERVQWRPSFALRGLTELPVVWG